MGPFLGAEMDVFVLCSNLSDLEEDEEDEEGRWVSADRKTWKEKTCAIGTELRRKICPPFGARNWIEVFPNMSQVSNFLFFFFCG